MAESGDKKGTEVPVFHGSSVALHIASNEWTFFVSRVVPFPDEGDKPVNVHPECIIQVSPQTAKDLYLIVKSGVEEYENDYGTIETAFSRSLEKKEE